MKKDTRDILIVAGAAVVAVVVLFSGLYAYAGLWPPFSVVESGSMQHSDRSTLTTIDTGDMVVVRTTDKTDIRSYVEGWHNGYSKFGEYGDVIIYERGGGKNPVIHRPILWLELNADRQSWSAPSLEGYPYWENLNNGVVNTDPNNLKGILTLTNLGYTGGSFAINLSEPILINGGSGYLTKGDHNGVFDQNNIPSGTSSYIIQTLVSEDMILYTAGFQIPWIGCIKLYMNNTNVSQIPPNSIPDMVCTIFVGILCLILLFMISDYISWYRHGDDDEDETSDNEEDEKE